jgi:hypothetical protein
VFPRKRSYLEVNINLQSILYCKSIGEVSAGLVQRERQGTVFAGGWKSDRI